jgi:TonB family protein
VRRPLWLLLCVALSACSQPDLERVEADFERLNPGCRVESVRPGEGDSDNVHLHIRYRCSSGRLEKVEWLYQRVDGEWRRTPPVPAQSTSRDVAEAQSSRATQPSRPPASAPLRISSDIVAPVVIKRVEPRLPGVETRRIRRAGSIVLEGVVTTDGQFRNVRIVRGEDDPLAGYVLEAVKQWRFRPALKDGQPVEVIYNVSANIDVR